MNSHNRFCHLLLPLAITAVLATGTVTAQPNRRGEVQAGATLGMQTGDSVARGSGAGNVDSVRALSYVGTTPRPLTNVDVTPQVISGGIMVPRAPSPLPNPPPPFAVLWGVSQSGFIRVTWTQNGRVLGSQNFSPSVVMVRRFAGTTGTSLSFPKSLFFMPNDGIGIQSETLGWTGLGQMTVGANGEYDLLSRAQSPGGVIAGRAAGQAIDPFTISSPTALTYAPSIDSDIEIQSSDEFAAADFWATDSSIDQYAADGDVPSPSDSLWFLSIFADQTTGGLGDLNIDFDLNPEALNEIIFPSSFLASLGPYSNSTQEAELIDAYIDNEIESALTFSGDTAGLPTGFDLLPDGTTFLPEGGSVTYEDGVEAGIAATPEGGTFGYIFLGGLVLVFAVRMRARTA